jgi:hypothetical protein
LHCATSDVQNQNSILGAGGTAESAIETFPGLMQRADDALRGGIPVAETGDRHGFLAEQLP